jgi:hypothetical protein
MAHEEAINPGKGPPKLPPTLSQSAAVEHAPSVHPHHARGWLLEEGPWWLCSFVFHMALVLTLALLGGKVVEKIIDEAPAFEEAVVEKPPEDVPEKIERFELGQTQIGRAHV